MDYQDKLLYGNAASVKILGFSQEDLKERDAWDLQTTDILENRVSEQTNYGLHGLSFC